MRVWVAALIVIVLVVAAPAAAQGGKYPTKLWSAYPLAPEVEQRISPSVDSFLPPSDTSAAPAPGDGQPWGVWALAAAAGVVALLVAVRVTQLAHGHLLGAPIRLGPPAYPRPSRRTVFAQYAPAPSLVLEDAPEEPQRSVVRRTGLLRSRYVVLERKSSGRPKAVAASKGFWNVGGAATREHFAVDAWDDLVNDLRASGWEPDPTRRSEFYVLLQPVAVAPARSSIVPTLEAYGRGDDAEA